MAQQPERKPDTWGPSPWVLAIALAAVAGGLAWWWPTAAPPRVATASPAHLALASASMPPPAASRPVAGVPPVVTLAANQAGPARIPRQRDPNGDQSPDLADYLNEGERPGMAEVIQRLHAAGVHSGLGAFNPPGTRQPLIGLAVPEGFELPPGYVRHHQATDDGQRIEPMLMFSPDAQSVVINGRTVAVPADRVVTPELAPPGLPIRRIVVPAPADGPR